MEEAFVILALNPGGRFVERSLVDTAGDRWTRLAAGGFLQLDARAICQHGQGLGKIDPFHLHHKAENIAADVAGPTFPRLPLGVDLEAGPGVIVPGAVRDIAAALATKLQIVLAQQIDDIDRLSNLFLGVKGRVEGHLRLPCGVRGDIHFACGELAPHTVLY